MLRAAAQHEFVDRPERHDFKKIESKAKCDPSKSNVSATETATDDVVTFAKEEAIGKGIEIIAGTGASTGYGLFNSPQGNPITPESAQVEDPNSQYNIARAQEARKAKILASAKAKAAADAKARAAKAAKEKAAKERSERAYHEHVTERHVREKEHFEREGGGYRMPALGY